MIRPLLLTVPGLNGSGPDHWQSIWERERRDCHRVDLGDWARPNRTAWMTRIDQAVTAARAPVVLVAHSLGCHAVAWWANLLGPSGASTVLGALLVAPPAVERADVDPRLAPFGGLARRSLPFVSLIIASDDDPYATFGESRSLARQWGAGVIALPGHGHINAQSGLDAWPAGQRLAELLRDARTGSVRKLELQGRGIVSTGLAARSSPLAATATLRPVEYERAIRER